MPLAARDSLLLTTDGLLDNLHASEIVAGIRKGPLAKSVNHLTNEARDRMVAVAPNGLPSKPDDLTVVAYRQR
jgi:serine/threonine protein phosphatase PrpC